MKKFGWISVLAALLLLAVVRILVHDELTQDDIVFLDAAYRITDHHRLALGIWGNALGHETLLASYPPVVPMIGALDVWLMRLTHSVLVAKSSVVTLLLVSAALFWHYLRFLPSPRLRALLVFATFVEPVSMTFYFTLRPEALLMPLMLVLFMSAGHVIDGDSRPRASLLVATLIAILTHWQFPSTLAWVALAVGAVAVSRRSGRLFATLYLAAIAATYAAYAGWIAASPERAQSFQWQMLATGSPSGVATKLKFLGGNVLAGNLAAGSGFSIYLLAALCVLLLRLAGPDPAQGPRDRGRALFQLGFLAAALAPALALDYIGPRAIPLYLVAVVILLDALWGPRPLRIGWLAACGVAAALANAVGHALIQHLYNHRPWTQAVIAMPLVWLAVSLAVPILARAVRDLRWAAAAAGSGVALVSVAGYVSLMSQHGLPLKDGVVRAIAAELPDSEIRGKAVLCDVRDFYLPLRQFGAPAHIYATFPLLHYQEAAAFEGFIADMRPDVILGTDALERELQSDTPAAQRFREWRAREFVLTRTFSVDAHPMSIYLRRPREGARRDR